MSEDIPLVDLAAQHREVAAEVATGFEEILSRTAFVGGPYVTAFESAFASFCDVDHCVGVGNGTDALELALRAVGVGVGDEVIIPANTFVASAEAVVRAGAHPVLVDCDADTYLMRVDQVADAITPRTRAVMPVHLYGQAVSVETLGEVVAGTNIAIVEDAAQAQGARRHGSPAGSLGKAAGTSFYPGKNLGAYGDAGAVLTDDDEIATTVRALRNHGGVAKYEHRLAGMNSRLDALQAVVLSAKLKRLNGWNAARRRAAERYDALLGGLEAVVRPVTLPGNEHIWHLYVVRVPHRDAVLGKLQAAGIGAGIHYPAPIHLLEAFRWLQLKPGSYPVAETSAASILSLPLYPEITLSAQERVVETLCEALM